MRLNRTAKIKRLSNVLAPFILAFGGQTKTNYHYFEVHPSEGKFEPDNRSFWSDIARLRTLPRPPVISKVGIFLRVHFPWMSSVALLSVAHLEAVVAIVSMLTNGRPNSIAKRIIEHVIPAMEPHGADDVLVHPFDSKETVGMQALRLDIGPEQIWETAATNAFGRTMLKHGDKKGFLERQAHRRKCHFTDEEDKLLLKAFADWQRINQFTLIRGRLSMAYGLATNHELIHFQQRDAVTEQLRLWLHEDGVLE